MSTDNDILVWNGSEQTVASVDLPSAGSYVLVAKVLGNNNELSASAELVCGLRLGGVAVDSATGYVRVDTTNETVDRTYIPLTGAGTVTGPSTATVSCTSNRTTGNWLSRSLVAIKVGSLG